MDEDILYILSKLNTSERNAILNLLNKTDKDKRDLRNIQIDDKIYNIPFPVYDLIDNLTLQIKELSSFYTNSSIEDPN